MNIPAALFVELLAGVAMGAGRSLGMWGVDRIRLQAEEGVPIFPLRLPRERPPATSTSKRGKAGCPLPCRSAKAVTDRRRKLVEGHYRDEYPRTVGGDAGARRVHPGLPPTPMQTTCIPSTCSSSSCRGPGRGVDAGSRGIESPRCSAASSPPLLHP